jgi:HPt (histidine-containing phosphotransfer) domain-containing protein
MPDAPDASPLDASPDRGDDARVALDRLRRFGGEALAREMTAMFAELAEERLAATRQALAGGDRDALAHAAHSLKPTCGQMGATVAERLCRQLEALAPSGDVATLAELVDRLEGECAAHHAALGRELGVTA